MAVRGCRLSAKLRLSRSFSTSIDTSPSRRMRGPPLMASINLARGRRQPTIQLYCIAQGDLLSRLVFDTSGQHPLAGLKGERPSLPPDLLDPDGDRVVGDGSVAQPL